MQAFAIWMGRLGAALAALLAVVWLIEASPENEPPVTAATMACSMARTDRHTAVLTANRAMQMEAEARIRAVCPRDPRKHWDAELTDRGLLAGAVALALLLLSAMVPRRHV